MTETCSRCRETFKEENITTCGGCGLDFCYGCMATHQRESGRKQKKRRWDLDMEVRADEYLKARFGRKKWSYIPSGAYQDRDGNLVVGLRLDDHPSKLGMITVRVPPEEIARNPKLSADAGAWGQGEGLGEYLTRYLVETHGLKAKSVSTVAIDMELMERVIKSTKG